jgi:hypothetical protein
MTSTPSTNDDPTYQDGTVPADADFVDSSYDNDKLSEEDKENSALRDLPGGEPEADEGKEGADGPTALP